MPCDEFRLKPAMTPPASKHAITFVLITVFLDTLPQWLIDLHQAIESQDQPLAKRLAHTLKGSLRQFGAAAAETAQALETAAENSQFSEATTTFAVLKTELERLRPLMAARR